VPIEQPRQDCERIVGHTAAVPVLNVIKQPNNVLALDAADLATTTKSGIDQPLEDALTLADSTKALLADEVFLGDGAQRIGSGPLCLFDIRLAPSAGSRPWLTANMASAASLRAAANVMPGGSVSFRGTPKNR